MVCHELGPMVKGWVCEAVRWSMIWDEEAVWMRWCKSRRRQSVESFMVIFIGEYGRI